MAERLELEITGGNLVGHRYAVKTGGVKLGRSSSNDIHVPDIELSRVHCLFEPVGETGIQVTDLGSANGTFVNGEPIGTATRELHVGDLVLVGDTALRVVKGGKAVLFEPMSAPAERKASAQSSRLGRTLLWSGTAAVLVLLAGLVVLLERNESEAPVAPVTSSALETIRYERVKGDSESIFRFYLEFTGNGELSVAVDDIPNENRHVTKHVTLSPVKCRALAELVADPAFARLDRAYTGPDTEPPTLTSYDLQIGPRRVQVINTTEPKVFAALREKLEAFALNELGIRALQYDRKQLLSFAAQCAETGRAKWEDRNVANGNLYQSYRGYAEAVVYLETVNPKPPEYNTYLAGLTQARTELDRRYTDQRFRAERAQKLEDWAKAREELQVLLEILVDREDPRYREAQSELVDVEKRLRKGGPQ